MASGVRAASGLVAGVILSRLGLWGFDLCAQSIVQDEVAEGGRGAFWTVAAAAQSCCEMLAYASTVMFADPRQFRWPAAMSVAAVYAAGGLHALFVRRRRGHLVHVPTCVKGRSYGEWRLVGNP